jgi:hypothetical protein
MVSGVTQSESVSESESEIITTVETVLRGPQFRSRIDSRSADLDL